MNCKLVFVTARSGDRALAPEGTQASRARGVRVRMLGASMLGALALAVVPASASQAHGHVDGYDIDAQGSLVRYIAEVVRDGVVPSHRVLLHGVSLTS
jgi:hypothetical protein